MRAARLAGVIACIFIAAVASAAAQGASDFYRGKQLRFIIRAGPGGNYDVYSRLLAQHMVRFIPGNPTPVPVNMPGGSGMTAMKNIGEIAPRDGTSLTLVTPTFPMEQALGTNPNLTVDMRRLNWIGNLTRANTILVTSPASATRSIEDARGRETMIAVPSTADITSMLANLLNTLGGTRFKLVVGYPSGPEMNLAMQRGEVDGRGTSNLQSLLVGSAKGAAALADFHLLVQVGLRRDPAHGDVPLLVDLATGPEQRAAFEFISKVVAIARPLATTADVPPERVALLRRAFDATMKDPAFLADAERQGMDIDAMSGEDVQAAVSEILDAPADLKARVRAAIGADAIGEPETARRAKP